jgi:putative transposase
MINNISPAPEDPSEKAMLRFSAVTWVIQEHQTIGRPLAECFRAAALRPWPDLAGRYYTFSAIEKWYYIYKKHGLAGLQNHVREDKGVSRTISDQLGKWIVQEVENATPKIPLTTLCEQWDLHGEMPLEEGQDAPHIDAIRRYLKEQGIERRSSPEARCGATKAFETRATGDLWMTDFSPGPYLTSPEGGAPKVTHLCIIIDDHSRLVTHAAYYPREDSAAFHDCLKCAIRKRGLPYKLYTDNGKVFVSNHSKQICARLGIQLLHARPYHSWSKGKVERVIRTIQLGFEEWFRLENKNHTATLTDLNNKLRHWLDQVYHQRIHRSTKQTPLQRYLQALQAKQIRILDISNELELERCFYFTTTRKVRSNGTIQLDGTHYEVSLSLKGKTIEIRYNPLSKDCIEVWLKKTSHGQATPVDYLFNARRRAPGQDPDNQQ